MAVCAIALLLAERIQRVLGERFIIAVERLMGLILVAVSVELLLRGFKTFAQQLGARVRMVGWPLMLDRNFFVNAI